MVQSAEIRWPEYYQPQNCPVHVRNELDMAATPQHIWAWLVRADLWSQWYANSANVRFLDNSFPILIQGTRFRWRTFGVTITSTVLEYVPEERIAWDGHAFGVHVYHAWLLRPSAKGCHVLTEESQHGCLARLSHLAMPKRMHHHHQLWLTGMEEKAGSGLPPT